MISPLESHRRGLRITDETFRRHTWAYIAGAAITVVGGAISSNQAKKKAAAPAAYQNVNLQDEQQNALEGNINSQGSIEQLLSRSNQFQQNQALSLTEKAIPGYAKLSKGLTDTSTSLLDRPYDLPADVQQNLARIAAERGISTGTRGEFNNFSLLRDLGINSLQYGQSRIGQAGQLAQIVSSIAPKVNPMSPLAFYVTPSQNAANTTNNNQNNQAIQQGANNSRAAANNANNDTWGQLINGVAGIASNYVQNNVGKSGVNNSGGAGTMGGPSNLNLPGGS